MEIILVLMALGATPFGAALLDKPTRKRFVQFAKAHASKSLLSRDGHISMAEALKIEPRNKDWKADEALQALWQDAFDWWNLPDRDAALAEWLGTMSELEKHKAKLKEIIRLNDKIYKDYLSQGSRSINVYDAVDAKHAAADDRAELASMDKRYLNTLSPEAKIAGRIAQRYGKEVFYNNDLIRLSAKDKMPVFDYLALTANTK